MYENSAVQYELLSSSYELPPYDLAESMETEQQIYETPYEDEEIYGPIYSAPSSDEQKIYEEFEGKRFCKLYHRELKYEIQLMIYDCTYFQQLGYGMYIKIPLMKHQNHTMKTIMIH